MHVNIKDAALFVGMAEAFGLPLTSEKQYEELFGPYHFEDNAQLFSYEPQDRVWSIRRGSESTDRWGLVHTEWSDEEKEELADLLDGLSLMKKPEPPSVPGYFEEPPFVYQGWHFCWVFFPELKRWELAPIGRR